MNTWYSGIRPTIFLVAGKVEPIANFYPTGGAWSWVSNLRHRDRSATT